MVVKFMVKVKDIENTVYNHVGKVMVTNVMIQKSAEGRHVMSVIKVLREAASSLTLSCCAAIVAVVLIADCIVDTARVLTTISLTRKAIVGRQDLQAPWTSSVAGTQITTLTMLAVSR